MSTPLRIVVAGSIAGTPGHGGWAWALLQYVLGLRRLGHRVLWIDPIAPSSIRPRGATLERSANAEYFRDVASRFGVGGCWVLFVQEEAGSSHDGSLHDDTKSHTHEDVYARDGSPGCAGTILGCTWPDLLHVVRDSDLLINVSGVLTDERVLGAASRRVYLDLDPGFTQLWQAVDGVDMRLDAHTDFVTIGPGLSESGIPTLGREWIPTLQPIVLSEWPAAEVEDVEHDAFTTVANWRGYGSIAAEGLFFGQKAHSFRQFLDLPARTGARFTLALGIHPDERRDLEALHAGGWQLADPASVAGTPASYRDFVRRSRAELAIAKSGYVVRPTGWFSDRSICYLASGRPVAAQDTGFAAHVPAGCGIVPFSTLEEAVDAVARIRRDYSLHTRAARAIAEECFDSDRVLTRLLRQLGAAG